MRNLLIRLFCFIVCPQVSVEITKNESCYDHTTETIYINPDEIDEYGFMRHVREVHDCDFADDISYCVWAILHEIGHYHTLDDCEEDDLLARSFCMICPNNIETQNLYFGLEAEWEATEWAINYVSDHRTLCNIASHIF